MEQFDAKQEVQKLNTIIRSTVEHLNGVHPAEYNSDTSHLVAELVNLTPKQLQDTVTAMGPARQGLFRTWHDRVGVKSAVKDGNGNTTEIIFDQCPGMTFSSSEASGTIDVDFSKRSVHTSTTNSAGRTEEQISKF